MLRAMTDATERRPMRPYVYAVLDLAFAVLYVVIATRLAISATGQFETASFVVAGAVGLAGVGTALRSRGGWWLAVAGCVVVALAAVLLLVLLVASAAFMHGIYGSIGRAASTVTLAI